MKEEAKKRRILFVDDEPNILQGLRRMLRSMRRQWDMEFAESGARALEILGRERFDVVVSDMRMPGMDGSQLLSEVRKRYPEVVRVILSGHSDQELILKSVRPAHQYLSKPCDPSLLISTIQRACSLRDLLGQESLKRVVSRTESLPSLPHVYVKMMDALQSPDESIGRVGKIIAEDIGISAKILQLVNSSFFGLPRHISDPSQAVMLLGLDTIKALALTVSLFSQFPQSTVSVFNIECIYKHSIRTGALAREIAKTEKMDDDVVDDAFMAGLLHDLGKLVFAANFPQDYLKTMEYANLAKIPLNEAEFHRLGASHAEVGAYLLGLWGLPDPIVEGVAFHHNPSNCPVSEFGVHVSVYAANILENYYFKTSKMKNVVQVLDEEYLKSMGLNERIPAWRDVSQQIEWETI